MNAPEPGRGAHGHVLAAWRVMAWIALGALVWLSVTPRPPALDLPQGDKLQHLAAYALLTFWFVQLPVSRAGRWRNALALAAFGVSMEFVQLAIGYRTFSVWDMAANTLGVAVGLQLGPPHLPNVPEALARTLEARR